MTAQVLDSITVDERRRVIDEWDGARDWVPANESLGFRTVSPATNNWHGRIGHFLIWASHHFQDAHKDPRQIQAATWPQVRFPVGRHLLAIAI